MKKITSKILKDIYKKRPSQSRKYDFGLLIVIGGGGFYTGSPALSAMAGFRTGCDMVQILAPKRAADIIAGFSPNLAAYALKGNWLDKEDLPVLLSMTAAAKSVSRGRVAVVIGGGLGRSQATQETVLEYLSQIDVPCVIDADGLHALAKNPSIIAGKKFLLTPHKSEFSLLAGNVVEGKNIEQETLLVKRLADKLQTTILLKGAVDIVAGFGQRQEMLSSTGHPSMTVGGTGDTLAGIAGALLARGVDCLTAGVASAYINGMAGQAGAKKFGESMLATDLIDEIPNILLKL